MCAFKQLYAKFLLNIFYVPGEDRLRKIKLFSSPGKTLVLGNRDHIF